MVKKPSAKIDSLLEPLLPPASDEQADEFVSRLISVYAEPVIKGIIRYKLHLSSHHAAQQAEADDIYQDVLVQFLTELRQLREQPDVYPIVDVRGLAAVIAHRTCSRWMRRQFPERHGLKTRLHYLLTRQRGLALWQNENGKLVAGFAVWQGQKKAATAERLGQLSDQEDLLAQIESLKANSPRKGPGGALASVFDYLGGPVEFDELVSTLATLLKIRDQPLASTDQSEDAIGCAAAAGNLNASTQVNSSTAIGVGAKVSTSNTIVLGTSLETTQIPGLLSAGNGAMNVVTSSIGGGVVGNNLYIHQLNQPAALPHLCWMVAPDGVQGLLITTCTSSAAPSSYKTDLQTYTDGLEVIKRLQPMSFAWKEGGGRGVGLSAEAVAEVAPLLVTRNAKGEAEDVKHENLNALFINAFKEQQSQLEKQQNLIEALKKLACLDHPGSDLCR